MAAAMVEKAVLDIRHRNQSRIHAENCENALPTPFSILVGWICFAQTILERLQVKACDVNVSDSVFDSGFWNAGRRDNARMEKSTKYGRKYENIVPRWYRRKYLPMCLQNSTCKTVILDVFFYKNIA